MGKCMNVIGLTVICCAFIALGLAITSLVLICLAKKQAQKKKTRKVNAIKRWNKVLDAGIRLKGGQM